MGTDTTPAIQVEDWQSLYGGTVYRVYCDECGYVLTGERTRAIADAKAERHARDFHGVTA